MGFVHDIAAHDRERQLRHKVSLSDRSARGPSQDVFAVRFAPLGGAVPANRQHVRPLARFLMACMQGQTGNDDCDAAGGVQASL
jgi:hypothetical protein